MRLRTSSVLALLLLVTCLSGPARSGDDARLPRPTPEQAAWQDLELGLFYHFDISVFTDRGEGDWKRQGHLDPNLYNPNKLDTDQWLAAAKAMGAGYTVFVAKHGTGFISWQSDAYPYGVRQSKWRGGKGDVVADYVASCRKCGIKPGLYCSMSANAHCDVFDNCTVKGTNGPGDPRQVEYRRRAERLVTELWGNYGPLAYIWFDGGTLPPDKGGPDLVPILKRLQTHAVTFQGPPDNPAGNTRWPGNERGVTGDPSWSTVAGANEGGAGNPGGKVWQPGECDAPLRNHAWFWHPHQESKIRSVDELVEMYYGSVGRGCNLILNGNIDRDGLVPAADLKRLKEFGDEIRRRFGKSIAETSGRGRTVELALARPTVIDNAIIMEQIGEGQRVRQFELEGLAGGRWTELARGQSIGHKRIERFPPVEVTKVRLRVVEAAAEPLIRKLAVYRVEANGARFGCDALGYVRHWAVTGPQRTPYAGRGGSGPQMRGEALDSKVIAPPSQAALGSPGPLGEPWRFYAPGENVFVECTAFYHKLTVLDYYAFTEIHASEDMSLPARLWAAGRADLWVNGSHVSRLDVFQGHRVESTPVRLPLHCGANQVCVRLQSLGARDTRMLFGLQVLEKTQDLRVQLSGPAAQSEQLAAAERWLQAVKPEGRDSLVSSLPAPKGVSVRTGPPTKSFTWPLGASRVAIDPASAFQATLTLAATGQKLVRLLEIPANQAAVAKPTASLAEHRRQYLDHMAASGRPTRDVLQVLARRTLGPPSAADTPTIVAALEGIEARKDCSDFTLAALLRLYVLKLVTDEEAAAIKRVALGFRYWFDEPGTDAMCFDSENHSLLFHGCQLLAGRLFPNETFTNSQRKGTEQAAIADKRCREWLDKREKEGFVEFFSSTYIPLTTGALMNVVDFSGDAELSRRAAALADRIFVDLATHAFDGVTVAPQGRVYRNVLYPQDSGTQALLSFATTEAAVGYTNWVALLTSSKTYRPPAGLGELMRQPASKRSRQTDAEIVLYKTPSYLLTSVAIPGSLVVKGNKPAGLLPGKPGYQQHLWHATLGWNCHVFVNHPGASFDQSESRPGFWYGNGVLPRVAQREGLLWEIFDIPESHPIAFTHAHWPADALEHQEVRDHWAFGSRGDGCIALWCSARLEPHNDVLSGQELRAWGQRAAWLCVCGSVQQSGGLDGFMRSCTALHPEFDASTRVLSMNGQEPFRWQEAK